MRSWVCTAILLGCGDRGSSDTVNAGLSGSPDLGTAADAPEVPPEPTVLSVSQIDPNHGPFSGGSVVVVRGTDFDSYAEVYIQGRLAEPAYQQYIDPTRIQIVTPAGEPGPADVEVVQGDQRASKKAAFTYDALAIEPNSGSIAGGTAVTIFGQGTNFDSDTTTTLDGEALTDVIVVSATQITAVTPAGDDGPADLVVTSGAGAVYEASDSFEYFSAVDPLMGGLGGGSLAGTLTITVVDIMTNSFIPGAYVIVGEDETTPYQGLTDDFGQISFVGDFVAPISVTTSANSNSTCFTYGASTIDSFDASEVVIYLLANPVFPPPPECMGEGTPPPGILASLITGVMQFGGPTGVGATDWTLVPEPGPGRYRCAHADTTRYNQFIANPEPGNEAWMIFDESSGKNAWEFSLYPVRPGTMATYVIAGHCVDGPDGAPVLAQAYAMGIARGIVAGPGEIVSADVIVDIALDQNISVDWVAPPPMGFPGPDTYTLDVMLDLGGDGILLRSDSRREVSPDALAVTVPGQAALTGAALYDASYLLIASAATTTYGGLASPVDGFYSVGNPFSVVVKRGVTDLDAVVIIDGFMGLPAPVDPPNAGTISNLHMAWRNPGATSSVNQVWLLDAVGAPAWWVVLEGSTTEYDLPDLTVAGSLVPLPPQQLTWIIWEIHKPSYDFNLFSYGDVLQETLWDAYAADAFLAYWP